MANHIRRLKGIQIHFIGIVIGGCSDDQGDRPGIFYFKFSLSVGQVSAFSAYPDYRFKFHSCTINLPAEDQLIFDTAHRRIFFS
ncbi:hypothetical protein D3C86_1895750 [compost metagenome]